MIEDELNYVHAYENTRLTSPRKFPALSIQIQFQSAYQRNQSPNYHNHFQNVMKYINNLKLHNNAYIHQNIVKYGIQTGL